MKTENTTLTDEGKALRLGQFTGSEIWKLMGEKGLGKTGETYVFEKAAEILTGQPNKDEFSTAATQWGIDHEFEAREYFEAATGVKVSNSETMSNGSISGTPDGILETLLTGFEIKCPFNSGNHLKNLGMSYALELLELRPEYYWQCVAYMWLTGLERWKFCSYDPRFIAPEKKMLILNLELIPEHFDLLKTRVEVAKNMLNRII